MSRRTRLSQKPAKTARLVGAVTVALAVLGGSLLQAGDILRGGAAVSNANRNATARANAGSDAAAQAQLNAKDRLSRTTQTIQAVRNMQKAASSSGSGRNVPEGLKPGGLQVATGANANWAGANLPTQSGNTVTIKQNESQAMLHWETFNVGKNTTVRFDQSSGGKDAGKWIAFNKIFDPSGAPSQILGSIKAEGQVYVLNQNGIIFGAGSQVNVRSLVASSLPINDNLVSLGLLNNADSQFLFTALALPAGANGTPAFTPPSPLTANGRIGNVVVEPGASISASVSAENTGGRIMLVAPNVNNQGSLSAPAGQVILAAGLQVGVTAHDSDDASLRGLDVYVGSVGDYGGVASNSGLIEVKRGSAFLTGKAVQQMGVIESSTSVSLNGRIDLLANYDAVSNVGYDPTVATSGEQFLNKQTGSVLLGADSVTRILPETESSEQIVGTELALRSQVNMQGLTIHMESGSTILAPNAKVSAKAGAWAFIDNAQNPSTQFVLSKGQIYLDNGSLIDVSGTTDVFVPLLQSLLTIELRAAELANSPLQRESVLRSRDAIVKLIVDLRDSGSYNGLDWVGTPLGDLSGYVGLIQRTVAQLTVAGGSIDLGAGDSVVLSKGATLDVSGGWMRYEGGVVNTSRVIYHGNLVNIDDALPDRIYDGVYTGTSSKSSAKWGVTKTYANPLALTGSHYQESYIGGAAGGSVTISAPAMALDGDIVGNVVQGPRQVRDGQTTSLPADLSSLTLHFRGQVQTGSANLTIYPEGMQVIFGSGIAQEAPQGFAVDQNGNPFSLPESRRKTVYLTPELMTKSGFGSLTVTNEDGDIRVPKGVTLQGGSDGSIALTGANVFIDGSVLAPGGSLAFTALNISPYAYGLIAASPNPVTPPPNAGRGIFALGEGAVLSTAGLFVDDRAIFRKDDFLPFSPDGGSIAISAYSASLPEGAVVDVSGGLTIGARGKRVAGVGGSISVKTGQDPVVLSVLGGTLELGADLRGYSLTKGGSLALQTELVQVGGSPTRSNTLFVEPEFFNKGGFASFTLSGLGGATGVTDSYIPGVVIAPNTVLEPVAQMLTLVMPTREHAAYSLQPTTLPMDSRSPVSLNFAAVGVRDVFTSVLTVRGDLVMGDGSVIRVDPGGGVSFKGDTAAILGSVFAPGGSIAVTGGSNSQALFSSQQNALGTVYIGPNSVLSAAGAVVLEQDPYGRRLGSVLPGGSITVSGNIVAAAGAVLDVSGASGVLDFAPSTANAALSYRVPANSGLNTPLYSISSVPVRVDSDGGVITLKGGQELFSAATLLGRAGGPSALGGSLAVSSGRFYNLGDSGTPTDVNLVVTQNPGTAFASYGAGTAIGQIVRDGAGNILPQLGHFSIASFYSGGFDSLDLGGVVRFQGAVDVRARGTLSVASGGVIYADSDVTLAAPYVKLGKPFVGPVPIAEVRPPFELAGQAYNVNPTYGSGRLFVKADLIDVGTLSLQNIGAASLVADGGAIRGDGYFSMAGDLYLRAAQIYPNTAVTFTLAVANYLQNNVSKNGSITIESSGVRSLPLTAGGTLSLYAADITQGGTLLAPFGTINIGWDGTGTAPKDPVSGQSVAVTQHLTLAAGGVTSVSAIDPITGLGVVIPYGLNLNGTSWIDPTGLDITASGLPQKTINIGGANLDVQSGSVIDIRGGGDLYAYRWVSGNQGTRDILGSSTSFAVIPGYAFNYAPQAGFSTSTTATNLGGDPGYVNSSLHVGDQIYLAASGTLPAGVYTLLPARYALLPGAVLVTPKSGVARGTLAMPDGSTIVSGYRYNSLNSSREVTGLASRFELASAEVVRSRAQYDDYFANSFIEQAAADLNITAPRLPEDAGHLILQASQAMVLRGTVLAQAGVKGAHGGMVDVASASDILITRPGVDGGPGVLTLDAGELSSFGAESLLIGGIRQVTSSGVKVTVRTNDITVDNAGTALSAPDIILAAKGDLTLAPGAEIAATGSIAGSADTLLIGDAATAGSGDGTLIRVSTDPLAQIVRSGVSSSTVPHMVIGAGSSLSGGSIILDSTYGTSLDPTANLSAYAISLNSGQISLLFDNPGAVQPTAGLVLSGGALQDLQATGSLSLLSYSSIDLYGAGQFHAGGDLALHGAQIRGFNNNGGTVSISAEGRLSLDNSPGRTFTDAVAPMQGALEFNASSITIGANQLNVSRFATLKLNAPQGIILQGSGGLATQGDLIATTSLLTTGKSATQALTAGGALQILTPSGAVTPTVAGGLGGSLTLTGGSILTTSDIVMHSGKLALQAKSGDVNVAGLLDVSGTAQNYYDVTKYTDGGEITLTADGGSVNLGADSVVNVSAVSGGGNAGSIAIKTLSGGFNLNGLLLGKGGQGGTNGVFSLDVGSLASTAALDAVLNDASFTQSRTIRVRTGNVLIDGYAQSRNYNVSTDVGSITVSGMIDASGVTGGSISLQAHDSVTLLSGSKLTVAGQKFSNAGKGGSVSLEAGSQRNGVVGTGSVDIQTGSVIDLSVASKVAGSQTTAGTSAYYGQFSGTLHIRAAQNAAHTDLLVNPINGTIVDASSIVVEGYRLYDLTSSGAAGTITSALQTTIFNDAQAFLGANGTTTANYTAMQNRLLANNAGLSSVFVLAPGVEIINRAGDLTLGTTTSTATSDWNLSTFRFGPKGAAGVLTLKASNNIVLYNALSDGFASSAYNALLLDQNTALPANAQSWSYRLSAGADLSAADFRQVMPTSALGANAGYVKIGKDNGSNTSNSNGSSNPAGANATTALALTNRYQVIRTGTGNIDIASGRSVQLLNQFATIYTAGTKVLNPTLGGTFDVPVVNLTGQNLSTLGAIQQTTPYAVQYSMAGGNVTLQAQENIEHLTMRNGVLSADSQSELPNNWLYRRGFIDPLTGEFGTGRYGGIASTTWWVDFSNFFQGVGALGGGDVTMIAGNDISNVDAVIPTNARMSKGVPNADNLLELGGGDLLVKTGGNLDAGVYYVERGLGTLNVGKDIVTNFTRSPSNTNIAAGNALDSHTWLPTTLFLGKGGFNVNARGDVLLGPVANVFLLPEGVNNSFWYKTYFSTYAPDSFVNVSSLGGSVNLRTGATVLSGSTTGAAEPLLYSWLRTKLFLGTAGNSQTASYYQPWLRLNETRVQPFMTSVSLMPGTLDVTAFSGDINLTGDITLSPAAKGSVQMIAAGSVNGLQPNGLAFLVSGNTTTWGSATINLSDANPLSIPGITSPYAYQAFLGSNGLIAAQARVTSTDFTLGLIDNLFAETGATNSVTQVKQTLHAPGPLHAGDTEPLRIYAASGSLSGFTLFSPKVSQIVAGEDISDVALYLQNVDAGDVSLILSGRDIIPYNANTPTRSASRAVGNIVNSDSDVLAGDIQLGGPGALSIVAGRNLDLGTGSSNADGTAVGITTIGNARNPYLGFDGASIFAGAGYDPDAIDWESFLEAHGDEYKGVFADGSPVDVAALPPEWRDFYAEAMFFAILRNTGRAINTSGGDYSAGFAAIDELFGGASRKGNILTRGRDIRTKNGGSIALLAPGGSLTLANSTIGTPLAPPGIVTEAGGDISIFTNGDVDIGIGRIFTLRGGDIVIWSSTGNIAAGSASKTVKSAPPTRVLIDPQSAEVQTDLAGLATGGGIGVLATVSNVQPGDVDLIAPVGYVDAGDAGIRASGSLNVAANEVRNPGNFDAPISLGVPQSPPVSAPNTAGFTAASSTAGAAANAANEVSQQARNQAGAEETPSIITAEVLGYGGGEEDAASAAAPYPRASDEERRREEEERKKQRPHTEE